MNLSKTASRRSIKSRRPREGYLYVAVLFTSLMIAAVTAASLLQSTAIYQATAMQSDHREAVRVAESELHRIAAWMQSDLTWRDGMNDTFSPWRYDVGYSLRSKYTDSDGSVGDNELDDVTVTVHARVGNSEAAIEGVLRPHLTHHPVLDYRCTSTKDFEVRDDSSVVADGKLQCGKNAQTNATGYLIAESFSYANSIDSSLIVRGDLTQSTVVEPVGDLIQPYVDIGTEIKISSIPKHGGKYCIEDVLLSATSNPYGPVDPNGIYWIDVPGEKFAIKRCRLECVLAFKKSGEINLQEGVVWDHPAYCSATILANEKIKIESLTQTLDESAISVNLNPASSPYRGTDSNTTSTDIYPTTIRGFIYSSGNIEITAPADNHRVQLSGAILCETFKSNALLSISHLPSLSTAPPLGLEVVDGVHFVHGSVRQIETP